MWSSKKILELVFVVVTGLAALITSTLLIVILGLILLRALPSITPYFILTPEVDTPGLGQGIANAIVGTIYLSVLSVLIATPLAVGTAIYLKKYAGDNFFSSSMRLLLDVLAGTPAIVLGVVGFFIFVYYMRSVTGGFSLLSGSISMAILILPVIERASEEAIDTVPPELEEGSYALGATKWATLKKIVVPYSISGIVTGMVLGVGRAAEESAIVILTAGYTQFFPEYSISRNNEMLMGIQIYPLQDMVATLPITVYHAYQFSQIIPISNGFAAAFILILIVMIINAISRLVLWRWKIG